MNHRSPGNMNLYVKFIHEATKCNLASPMKKLLPKQIAVLELQGSDNHCAIHSESELGNYASVLEACANAEALEEGKRIHAHMITRGVNETVFMGTKLLNMYAMCGGLADARLVFDRLPEKTVYLWNTMIRVYVMHGHCEIGLGLYYQMLRAGIQPDNFTFPFVIRACAGLGALQLGRVIHEYAIRKGFESDAFVASSIVDMYAKCGEIEAARQVFDKMSQRDVVLWNVMIAGHAKNGHWGEPLELFCQMRLSGVEPNSVTFASVLSACALVPTLQHGMEVHGCIIRSGFESSILVGNALVAMYGKCRRIEDAHNVFDKMTQRDEVTWNAIIAGYIQNGHCEEALELFCQMRFSGVKPNSVTMASVLPMCSGLDALQQGKEIHASVIRSGTESDAYVGSALVDMYTKCGNIENARIVFDRMFDRDVVSWSAMVAGYAQNGCGYEALKLFCQLQFEGVKPNSVTIASILPACAGLGTLKQGKEIHNYIIRNGFESHFFVGSALIDMYAKCGAVNVARQAFDEMSQRDVVSWNAMITGYSQNDQYDEALKLFPQMGLMVVQPDMVTISGVLSACAGLAALQHGQEIHNYIIRNGFESDVLVGSALIDMYVKCGNLKLGREVFETMPQRNVVSWNTMIAGYGMHGHGQDAIILFYQMQQTGMKPDHVTFIALMSACSHAGLVDEGCQFFNIMSQDYCIMPRVEHYACMVDLLGRAGRLEEAEILMKMMPFQPDAGAWGALLGACRIHCNIELAERVAECLFQLEPENCGYYVLLSNIYAVAGRWDNVSKVRMMIKGRGLKKIPGCSWIKAKNRVHVFSAGDKSHPDSKKIYAMLESLSGQMKKAGYMPNMDFVLHGMVEE